MLTLFLNLDAADPRDALVGSFTSQTGASPLAFFRDSDVDLRLHLLKVNRDDVTAAEIPFSYYADDPEELGVEIAVGEIDAQPTGGTFTLTDPAGSQTTGNISATADAATVQTAVRAGLSTNYSTATVTGSAGAWTITRGSNGAISSMTATATLLTPVNSSVIVTNSQDGTASLPEVFFIETARAVPLGANTGFTALDAAVVSVTTAQSGSATLNKVFDVRWSDDAYAGDVTFAFTGDTTTANVGPITYNATEEDVVEAFVAHVDVDADGVAVSKPGPGHYIITCVGAGIALSNTPALIERSNTLQVPIGLRVSLAANTAGLYDLLGGEESVDATFEITVNDELACQMDCTVFANLIRSAQGVASPFSPLANTELVIRRLPGVVGYTGGGATKLDGTPAADLAIGQLVCFIEATDGFVLYEVTSGTLATSSPGIIRCSDYTATTNEKYFKKWN